MNCEQFEDILGAYALGALPEDEMRQAEEHLRGCANHPEARDFQLVAVGLTAAAPEMDPPPALKSRLMDAVYADLGANAAPMFPLDDLPSAAEPRAGLLDAVVSWFSGPRLGYTLSGALAVVIAALLVWNVSLQSDDGGGPAETVVTLSGAASGRVVYIEDQQLAVMDIEGIAPAPEGHVYQVWAISGGQPASLGLLEVGEEGGATAAMKNISLEGVDTIAVTVEPTPGSDLPTTDPIIAGEV